RLPIRGKGWALRFFSSFSVLPYVLIPAAILSGTSTGIYKWVPGIWGHTIAQARPSLMAGLFHGFTAGMIWGTLIPLSLMIHRVVFFRRTGPLSPLRPLSALLWGAIAGLITGAVINLIVVGVYEVRSLVTMGWISS